MRIELLDAKHPEHDGQRWAENRALHEGGKRFRTLIESFLPRNPMEEQSVYDLRKKNATYRSYIGSIVSYLAGATFERSPDISEEGDVVEGDAAASESWFSDWSTDCDGEGTDWHDFLRARFLEALRAPRAYWLFEAVPPDDEIADPRTVSEHRANGASSVRLSAVQPEDMFSWKYGTDRKLEWCITHCCEEVRDTPFDGPNTMRETWKLYDRLKVTTFQATYQLGHRPPITEELPGVSEAHGFSEVPICSLQFEPNLRLVDELHDAQLGHFRASAALDHALRTAAYAMPYLKGAGNTDRVFGSGYFLELDEQAECGFLSPDGTPFEVLRQSESDKRQELYRLAHQMANGVDNNASAVGRSGESKAQDAKTTNTMLSAWGTKLAEATKRTLDMISAARRETTKWCVDGFDSFDAVDLAVLLDATPAIESIPSPTLKREYYKATGKGFLPGLSQSKRAQIDKEIDENVSDDPEPMASLMRDPKAMLAAATGMAPSQPKSPLVADDETDA